jgi:transcriptional regulator with XRE-family HTH domain
MDTTDNDPKLTFDAAAIAQHVGVHLQKMRRSKNIKQEVFADFLGLSRTTASNIERGKQRISIDQLYQAAALFRVSPGDLLPPLQPGKNPTVVLASNDEPLNASAMKSLLEAISDLPIPLRMSKRAGRKTLSRRIR